MDEGTNTAWHISEEASLKKGDVPYVAEREKVTAEVEAPDDRLLFDILVLTGEIAQVGQEDCRVESND